MNWYLLGEKNPHKIGSWYPLGVLFKIFDEHPCLFYVLITSKLANQRAWKVLFTCVVYTNINYSEFLDENTALFCCSL